MNYNENTNGYMTEEYFSQLVQEKNSFINNELDNEITTVNNFNMKTYFQYLDSNIAINSHGSCGYVALIECLSYYDTFYNDNIIPENFENDIINFDSITHALYRSPGVKSMPYPEPIDKQSFYNFVVENMDNDLQLTMMYENINWSNDYDDISTIVSINQTRYNQLLKQVIGEEISFSYTHYTEQMIHNEETKNYYAEYIKNNIDCGRPVIVTIINRNVLTGEYINSTCHSAVAYYYDEDGIHLNYGYSIIGSSDIMLGEAANDNEETLVMMAGVIDVSNYDHSHSNNYMIYDVYNCPCGAKSIDEVVSEFEISDNYINNFTTYFNKGSKKYYKLNVTNNLHTEFKFISSGTVDVKIYDYDLNVIEIINTTKKIVLLNRGIYYLKVL